MQAALMLGPIGVAIDGENEFLRFYQCGVITNATACGDQINHEVVAVGYNLANDPPYFILRNSWGDDWGNDGYFNVAITDGIGICAINKEVAFSNLNLAADGSAQPRDQTIPYVVSDKQSCAKPYKTDPKKTYTIWVGVILGSIALMFLTCCFYNKLKKKKRQEPNEEQLLLDVEARNDEQ